MTTKTASKRECQTCRRSWTLQGADKHQKHCADNTLSLADLQMILELGGIRNIVLTGVTTDVCVHTTMRDANDRGYECLILSDCTGATDPGNHAAALKMVTMQVQTLSNGLPVWAAGLVCLRL